jgi:large subunit ribosomal protein L5
MNIKEKYNTEVMSDLQEKVGYKNVMAIPRIEKVVINTGFGRLITSKTGEDYRKTLDGITKDLSSITGQHAALTKAKHSIAGFKLREGTPVGAKVTLRGKRMYDFLDRLIHVVLPRSRDFRGIEFSTVDSQGNLSLGVKEHIFFPEISPEKVKDIFGLQVTAATSARTREEGLELFRLLGVPFKKEEE